MQKITASIRKEVLLLLRDRIGLLVLFFMPVVLVIVITMVQNSAFELINENKISLLVSNHDHEKASKEFLAGLEEMNVFEITVRNAPESELKKSFNGNDFLAAIYIPAGYTKALEEKTNRATQKSLIEFGLPSEPDSTTSATAVWNDSLRVYYNPVLQESYRYSIRGSIQSVLSFTENKWMIRSLYFAMNQKEMSDSSEKKSMQDGMRLSEGYLSGQEKSNPNATQHNIPAWTLFAMFFVVISLGGNVVKEKLRGSFVRLRTMPSSFMISLCAKQIVFLMVILLQTILIFSIGKFIFPSLGLPILVMPENLFFLFLVTFICGWCAISYALLVGVFANTQEQANGFGAVSVVILAAIGGIIVPSFAMPNSFAWIQKISPLHYGIEAYYGIFLRNLSASRLIINILPLFAFILLFQVGIFIGLKRKNLL